MKINKMASTKQYRKTAFQISGPYDVDSISHDNDNDDDDDDESKSDGSTSSHTSAIDSEHAEGIDSKESNYNNAITEVQRAVKDQERAVYWWRLIVKVIMITMAIMLTVMTYILLRQSENQDFEAALLVYAKTLISKVNVELRVLEGSLEAYSDGVTSYSIYTAPIPGRSPWPHVTIPQDEFFAHAEHVASLSTDGFVWISPIVDDVAEWEKYCFTSMTGKTPMSPYMYSYGSDGVATAVNGTGTFTPIHQAFPEPTYFANVSGSIVNYDTSSDLGLKNAIISVSKLGKATISGLLSFPLLRDAYSQSFDAIEPISMVVEPIYSAFTNGAIVGYVQSLIEWKFLLSHIGSNEPVVCIVENTCGDSFSYLIKNMSATYISIDDAMNKIVDGVSVASNIGLKDDSTSDLQKEIDSGVCVYKMTIYPTIEYRQQFNSKVGLYTTIVCMSMLIMVGSFFAYDYFVSRRNEIVIRSAVRSTAIVSAMFPANVRSRLYEEQDDNSNRRKQHGNLKSYLRDGSSIVLNGAQETDMNAKPLADLFTETTVLFADIAGFTAWSSVREPCQVFVLLETLYAAFDAIATRRRIFKVETIGDCYVAVTGLPEPRADHAVAMCKFGTDMIKTMRKLTKQMESKLGPETGDLTLRIGIHSGPVTAGVLRGERARFQLFGDTMNTAARMEQTCSNDRIQLSQATADILVASGKSNWLQTREDKVMAKGKGELTTYWLEVNSNRSGCQSSRSSESRGDEDDDGNHLHQTAPIQSATTMLKKKKLLSEKTERLIDWNVDVMVRLLQQITATRLEGRHGAELAIDDDDWDYQDVANAIKTNPFDEVKEIMPLPQEKKKYSDSSNVVISTEVTNQLRDYLSHIASMYNDNQFHNFEHASHVTMSVTKLLSRIVAPVDVLSDYEDRADKDLVSTLHDHTYGITSDPLTQFACIFSALIHDVDHAGVPNSQLVTENTELADRYDGKSVAEQNSIDVAWTLLMNDEYKELCKVICATKSELIRFRQLVVNAVMATDIMDKELKQIRNTRWAKAFDDNLQSSDGNVILSKQEILDQVNRKATIVIEHLIQASDVSHTMQHWHIYRKWNERFFWECYDAYETGRSTVDPLDTWYEGELGFYDYYIIPLAKKLKDCGVFGVSSDEYLQYAINNRSEWEIRGRDIVAELKEDVLSRKKVIRRTVT